MMWSAAIGGGVATKMWYDEVNDYVKIFKNYTSGDFHMKTGMGESHSERRCKNTSGLQVTSVK